MVTKQANLPTRVKACIGYEQVEKIKLTPIAQFAVPKAFNSRQSTLQLKPISRLNERIEYASLSKLYDI